MHYSFWHPQITSKKSSVTHDKLFRPSNQLDQISCFKIEGETTYDSNLSRDRGRKVGGTIGMAAGATTGVAGLFQGAQAGWNVVSVIA